MGTNLERVAVALYIIQNKQFVVLGLQFAIGDDDA